MKIVILNQLTITSWNKIIEEGKDSSWNSNENETYLNFNLKESINKHKRGDTACIIYTSGTGGSPKGVMLKSWGNANKLFWCSSSTQKFNF